MEVEEKQVENTEVSDLLRQLLTQVEDQLNGKDALAETEGAETVIYQVELDGVQYTLTSRPCPGEDEQQVCLSPREQEVARLVMKGLTTWAIATVLDISPWTVSTHLRRVFAKLGVNSRAEMVACLLRSG